MAIYQDFVISAVDTDLKNKTINITATLDVDPKSVTDATVQVLDLVSKNLVEYTTEVSGCNVILTFKDWPRPNSSYIIKIQDILSVLGDKLTSSMRRRLLFESSIASRIEILHPAFDEVVSDLYVQWNEIAPEPTVHYPIGKYYIEFAKDIGFFNVIKTTEVIDGRKSLDISDLNKGQYYVRVRAQSDQITTKGELQDEVIKGWSYGEWSEVVTFLVGTEYQNGNEPIEEIYVPNIEIVSKPQSGTTPSSIMIQFDCDIDPASIANIIVTRRKL